MKRRIVQAAWLAVALCGAALISCGGSSQKDQTPAMAQDQTPPADSAQTPAMDAQGEPDQSTPAPAPAQTTTPRPPAAKTQKPPSPPPAREVTLEPGSTIKAALQQELISDQAKAGDTFTLKVTEPVVVAGYTAVPMDATVQGEVVSAQESGKMSGRGEITLKFTSVTDVNGTVHPIETDTFHGEAEGVGDRDAAMIAGGAGAGAIIGGAVGAAAGTGTVLATKGPEVKLAPGTVFELHLQNAVYVPAGPEVAG